MLQEAHQLAAGGRDVVVGVAADRGRKETRALVPGLEVIGPLQPGTHNVLAHELDVEAVLARHPEVAIVDEYAHTNAPGSRNEHRWQDIELLLSAGVDVLSTVSVQHLASLSDVVSAITGQPPGETVPTTSCAGRTRLNSSTLPRNFSWAASASAR
jgi:two-component system sensor histidine kinase KdpD